MTTLRRSLSLSGWLHSVSAHVDSLLAANNYFALDERRQKIHQWLSAPDPSSNYHAALEKRQPTTGTWFIEGQAFADWKSSPHSFIWLHGIRKFFDLKYFIFPY
jgi:hypothetical protein